jgi:crossover junction endodeoxyribonuclease RuvC
VIVGIDPGAKGAIAFLTDGGDLLSVHDMPSYQIDVSGKKRTRIGAAEFANLLHDRTISAAYVERVGAMPGQGVASCFSFGYAAGIIEGALAALGVPVTFVTPQSWKKAMQLRSDKDACRQRAAQLFPRVAAQFSRVKDDGRAEAALIGLYGYQRGKS